MRNKKQVWVSKDFESVARREFPYKSMYEITKELGAVLEEALNELRKKR